MLGKCEGGGERNRTAVTDLNDCQTQDSKELVLQELGANVDFGLLSCIPLSVTGNGNKGPYIRLGL